MALVIVEEGANRGAAFPADGPETVLGRDLASYAGAIYRVTYQP